MAAPDPFAELLAAGFDALAAADPAAAETAFSRALELDPASSPAADGLAQARLLAREQAIVVASARARAAEAAERWREAESAWSAVLALDPAVKAARSGVSRAAERAELSAAIDFHLDHPERLAAGAVLTEASELLARAEAAEASGPRHARQVATLAALVARAAQPLAVILTSDGETEVSVLRVGRLGTFERRELELRPGTYTVVGSRRGYRDVRLTLEVAPPASGGGEPTRLDVRCEEAF